jgi:hypothetical protein
LRKLKSSQENGLSSEVRKRRKLNKLAGSAQRRIALPASVKHWTLTTLRDKLIKIGCKVVHHARRVVFQLAEVAIPRSLFALILRRIERLRLLVPQPP